MIGYQYDAEGNRVEKQGAGVTDTVYFGGQPVARYAGGQWTDLIYGPTGLLAEVPGTAAGQPSSHLTENLGTDVGTLLANGTFVNAIDHTQAQVETIRLKLFKIGAVVKISARRVLLELSSTYPWKHLYTQTFEALRT